MSESRSADWQVGEEKIVLRTRMAGIVSAEVRCQRTGSSEEFYRLVFPDWVNVVALTPDAHMVLVRQFRFGTERMEIEIPGGAVDPGESPVAAGCRELREETGYAGKDPRLIGIVSPNPAMQGNRCFTVLVEDVEQVGSQKMDDMEDIEVMLVPLEEVNNWVSQAKINHGLVLNALMFYEKERAGGR
jgi:8-oxo-dGTP pyrophosphatase MutT (NUDIX family)